MDLNNTKRVNNGNHKKKELILEARHSKVIEDAKYMRSKLPSRLFIPRPKKLGTIPLKLIENKSNESISLKNLAEIPKYVATARTVSCDTNSDGSSNKRRKLQHVERRLELMKFKQNNSYKRKALTKSKCETGEKLFNFGIKENATDPGWNDILDMPEISKEKTFSTVDNSNGEQNQDIEDILKEMGLEITDTNEISENSKNLNSTTQLTNSPNSKEAVVNNKGNNQMPVEILSNGMEINEGPDKATTLKAQYSWKQDKTLNMNKEVSETKNLNSITQPTNSQNSIEAAVNIRGNNQMPIKIPNNGMETNEASDKATTLKAQYSCKQDKSLNINKEASETKEYHQNYHQIADHKDCMNYKKRTRESMAAFGNIVRNAMTALNEYCPSSLHDLQIYNNLRDVEKSANDFSKFLLENCLAMDATMKSNELFYCKYYQQSLFRLQNSTKFTDSRHPSLSITYNEAAAQQFVQHVTAPEIPDQAQTFITSHLLKPTNLYLEKTTFSKENWFANEQPTRNYNDITKKANKMPRNDFPLPAFKTQIDIQSSTTTTFTAEQTSFENHRYPDRFVNNAQIHTTDYETLPDSENYLRETELSQTINRVNDILNYNKQNPMDYRMLLNEKSSLQSNSATHQATNNGNLLTASQNNIHSSVEANSQTYSSAASLQLLNNANLNFNCHLQPTHRHSKASRKSQHTILNAHNHRLAYQMPTIQNENYQTHQATNMNISSPMQLLQPSYPYHNANQNRIQTYSTNLRREVRSRYIEHDLSSPVNSNYSQQQQRNPAIIEQMPTTDHLRTPDYTSTFRPRTELTANNLEHSMCQQSTDHMPDGSSIASLARMPNLMDSPSFPAHNLKISSFPLTPPADGKMDYRNFPLIPCLVTTQENPHSYNVEWDHFIYI